MDSKVYITSKSKTFEKESDVIDLIDWVFMTVETEDREVFTNTPPDYDVRTISKQKYKITITNLK